MSENISLTVNGISYALTIDASQSLMSVLRDEIGLTGTKEGCDDSECGACIVLLDGEPVNSCSYLAVQAVERLITTVEGLARNGNLDEIQQEFLKAGAVQCGFCTPGMIMSAEALLARNPQPTEDDVRIALSGNLCRCTGYQQIVAAVLRAADARFHK